MQEGANAGQYIVWPEGLNLSYFEKNLKDELLSATDIAKHFNSSPQKVNKNLSSLGWIELQPKLLVGHKLEERDREVLNSNFNRQEVREVAQGHTEQ